MSHVENGLQLHVPRIERFFWLLKRGAISIYEDGCLGVAKGAAYSGLLCFFPVLTTVALILVQVKAEEISGVITRFLFEVVPPGTEELVQRRFTVTGAKPTSLIVFAMAVSLWAASGLFLSLIDGFNAVYKLPRGRGVVHGRVVAILLIFLCALPALGTSYMIVFGNNTEIWLVTTIGVLEQGDQLVGGVLLAGKLIRYLIVIGALATTMLLLYKLAPARPQSWFYIWPGALISTGVWFAATLLFSWYVRNIANYNLFYGSIGAVVALLLWMYMLSLVTLYGCAFNAEFERLERPTATLKH
jgi:membrane protein